MVLVVKLIGGVAASAIVMKSPLWGLFTLIIAIPFLPNEAMLIFTALVVFSFIIKAFITGDFDLMPDPLTVPLLAFAIVQIITTIISVSPFLSIQNLIVSLISMALYFTIVNTIKTKEDLDRVLKIFIITAFIMSCYGILQYYTLGATSKAWVDVEMNPDLKTRVIGTFGNPNVFAEYLEHILPVAIALIFAYKKWINKAIAVVLAGVMFVCLLLTSSRGAWLGFAAAMLMFVVLKFFKYIFFFLAGGVLSIPLAPKVILQRISTIGNIKDSSNEYRTYIWEGTIKMIKDFWITGVGYGYWAFKNTFYEYSIKGTKTWHSHNMYLEIIAEMGIFGLLTFAWFVLSLFIHSAKFILRTDDKYLSYVSTGLLAGFLSIMVHGVAEHILYMPKSVIMFWMFAAFISTARIIEAK